MLASKIRKQRKVVYNINYSNLYQLPIRFTKERIQFEKDIERTITVNIVLSQSQ